MPILRCFSVLLLSTLAACSSSSDSDEFVTLPESNPPLSPASSLSVPVRPEEGDPLLMRIRRTTAGVPHINGSSLAEVAAGLGYAQAQDNLCVLADGFIKVRGERAAFFGPGENDVNVISDFSYRALQLRTGADVELTALSTQSKSMVQGYVAGYNHYLASTEPNEWPIACRDAPWVRAIDAGDLVAYYRWLAQIASGDQFTSGALLAAVPPGVSPEPSVVSLDPEAMRWENRHQPSASNAWGIGSELSENGRGALLSNPHFPYTGSLRLYQSHLTIDGSMNVMGAGLLGTAIPLIMFNEQIAWTHTNSAPEH